MKTTYGFDAGIAGVFFMIPGLCYVLTAMVAGGLVDTFGGARAPQQEYRLKVSRRERPSLDSTSLCSLRRRSPSAQPRGCWQVTATIGYVIFVICFLFLAPAFARPALEQLAIFTPSLVALGVGFGLTVIPSFSGVAAIPVPTTLAAPT
eukprot:362999-Prymnesium_polylepis.1